MTIYITQDANDFTGSSNLFQANGRSPWNSTNFIDIHDASNGSSFCDPNSMYIAYNGWSGSVTFTLPTPPTGTN